MEKSSVFAGDKERKDLERAKRGEAPRGVAIEFWSSTFAGNIGGIT